MNRKTSFCTFLLLISIIFSLLFVSCTGEKTKRLYLDNFWQWCVGAEDGSVPLSIITGEGLKKLAIDQEKNLEDIFEDKKGYVWLRADFSIPEHLKYQDLGLFVGSIRLASQVYVNGKTIGTSGAFPPKEFSSGTAVNGYVIPYGLLNQTDKNTVILKIWTNSVGSISSRVFVTNAQDVMISAEWENFFVSKLNLSFSAAMLLIAVFYLFMYLTRKQSKEHLMFALVNFFSSFYLLPFYISEVPWINANVFSYLWFSKIFSGIIAHITVYFATSFMREFLHQKESKLVFYIRLIILFIPCVMIMLAKNYGEYTILLPISFIFVAIQIGFGIYTVLKSLLNKDKDVYAILGGFSPVCVMVIVDFVVHIIFKNTTQPYFTIMGWQGSIVAFLLILSVRYSRIYKQYEYLNGKLEAEVEQRTLDLMVTNKILNKEKEMSQRDMNMAVHIQKNFYPDLNQQFFGWDIAAYFQPQSGVSGDLFDFYENGDFIEGVSIFDVSGHGIPAGLVTMLSKNIIRREYQRGISQKRPLSKIMEDINTSIINGKGNIENYLTGLVIKLGKSYQVDRCKCQIVNAGHPHPLMYSVSKHEVIELYSRDKKSVGMIGIAGIAVDFPSFDFTMNNQDVLVLFTDGVNEYKNQFDEDYGKERLAEVLKNTGTSSAKKILSEILKDIKSFAQDVPQQDDITILVLKRNKEADYIPEL